MVLSSLKRIFLSDFVSKFCLVIEKKRKKNEKVICIHMDAIEQNV